MTNREAYNQFVMANGEELQPEQTDFGMEVFGEKMLSICNYIMSEPSVSVHGSDTVFDAIMMVTGLMILGPGHVDWFAFDHYISQPPDDMIE